MRYAIISDIHSNLEALQVVLKESLVAKVDVIWCGGDIVGYGANPRECLNLLHEFKVMAVAGNHDWAVSGKLDFSHFTNDGKAAIEWTRKHLVMRDFTYLNSLELLIKNKDCILVHASLHEPQAFHYMTNITKVIPSFSLMDTPVCFIGHTHIPGIFVQAEGKKYYLDATNMEIKDGYKYIVNVGSVGQPRDSNSMASFCIYDTQSRTIELRRLPYDVNEAQRKIFDAGLPVNLAYRLALGR